MNAGAVVCATSSADGAVLAAHIVAVLAAYGAPVTYPLLLPYLRRNHPAALPGVHSAQHWLNTRVAPPASVAIVAAGAYMAFDRDLWSEPWLVTAIALFVVISVVGLIAIVPSTRRLADLAGREGGSSSAEYAALYRRYMTVEVVLGLLVVAAVFVMAAKPG